MHSPKHPAKPSPHLSVCESALLHTAKPETAVRCANRPFYTPQGPKHLSGVRNCLNAVHAVQSAQPEAPRKTLAPPIGVRISPFAHRKARNRCPVCESTLLHTARPEAPVRCANRGFCTPRSPKHLSGVRIDPFTHRKARNPVPVRETALMRCTQCKVHSPKHPAKPSPHLSVCESALLHTAKPSHRST